MAEISARQWRALLALRCAYVRGLRDEFTEHGPVLVCTLASAYVGPPTVPTLAHARATFRMEAIP